MFRSTPIFARVLSGRKPLLLQTALPELSISIVLVKGSASKNIVYYRINCSGPLHTSPKVHTTQSGTTKRRTKTRQKTIIKSPVVNMGLALLFDSWSRCSTQRGTPELPVITLATHTYRITRESTPTPPMYRAHFVCCFSTQV